MHMALPVAEAIPSLISSNHSFGVGSGIAHGVCEGFNQDCEVDGGNIWR